MNSRSKGFTLIELLVSISMLAIVMMTLYSSYRSLLTHIPWIEKEVRLYEMARTCLNQMRTDLGAVYFVPSEAYRLPTDAKPSDPYRIVAETISWGSKSFPRLEFSSLFNLRWDEKSRQDIALIVYYVQPMNGSYVLRRSESLYPYTLFKENPADPVLCASVRSLTYTFFDRKGKEYHRWNSNSSDNKYETPVAVHIRLELGGKDDHPLIMETGLVFPVCREGVSGPNPVQPVSHQ